jgi:hypothetical protein
MPFSPQNLRFGGGSSDTSLDALVAFLMLLSIVLLFVVPRRHLLWVLLPSVFLIPVGPALVISGVHVYVSRIIVLAGWVRVLIRERSARSLLAGGFGTLDCIYVCWALLRAVAFMLLYRESGAVINQMGFLYDALGDFFLLRTLIRDIDSVRRVGMAFAAVAIVVAVCMVNEQFTKSNIFGELGLYRKVPEIREGRVRSQGPFLHALLAGAFGGVIIPLYCWLWKMKAKVLSASAILASFVIVVTTACSTSLLAYVAGPFALALWKVRTRMQLLRRALVAAILVLALVMKAPVWFAISHIDLTGSSSGYQRALLIDVFIRHFSEWWLLGVKDAGSWGFDMWDSCNQFVTEGELGGIVALALFITQISYCFSRLGTTRKIAAERGDTSSEWIAWCIGSMLFAQTVAYFGIGYFDQTQFLWLSLLALVPAVNLRPKGSSEGGRTGSDEPAAYFQPGEEVIVY